MRKEPYQFEHDGITEYKFISEGPKGRITKVVQFIPLQREGLFNIGFGDLTAAGKVDDTIESNNKDIVKVLATVIHIIEDFLTENPHVKVFFAGSNSQRTEIYRFILSRHFKSSTVTEIEYVPTDRGPFLGFLLQKK